MYVNDDDGHNSKNINNLTRQIKRFNFCLLFHNKNEFYEPLTKNDDSLRRE